MKLYKAIDVREGWQVRLEHHETVFTVVSRVVAALETVNFDTESNTVNVTRAVYFGLEGDRTLPWAVVDADTEIQATPPTP